MFVIALNPGNVFGSGAMWPVLIYPYSRLHDNKTVIVIVIELFANYYCYFASCMGYKPDS